LKRNNYFKLMYLYIAVSTFLLLGLLCNFDFAKSLEPLDRDWRSHYDFEHGCPKVEEPHCGGLMSFTERGMAYSNPFGAFLVVVFVVGFLPLVYFFPDEEEEVPP
jgi:hypothetical protein